MNKIGYFFSTICIALVLILNATSMRAQAGKNKVFVLIGSHETGPGKGFSLATFDTVSGMLSTPHFIAEAAAPSYFEISKYKKFLYSCNSITDFMGKKEGAVSAFSLDRKTGKLSLINQKLSAGENPCHVSLDKTGKFLFAANYNSGSVVAYRILSDGSLGEKTGFDQHSGSSIDPDRQEGPHAHCIKVDPTNHFVLATDLGTDKLMVYKFNSETGSFEANDPAFAKVTPGLGPRHFTFHPNGKYCYLLNEMGGKIVVFSWNSNKGVLTELQTISTLPQNFAGYNKSAEIRVHPSGKFLYCTNRGPNTIAVFSIDKSTGKLTYMEEVPTKGDMPRNFDFDPSGKWLVVTNHDGNNAVVFRIDVKTGKLTQNGEPVSVHNPFRLAFLVP